MATTDGGRAALETSAGAAGPEAEYLAHLQAGRFMIQRSRATGQHVFYPRVAVPGTGKQDLEWVPASGHGTVYSVTVNRSRDGAYNVALIDLAEGPRMMSRIEGVETLPVGTPVKARIAATPDGPAVVFDPAGV